MQIVKQQLWQVSLKEGACIACKTLLFPRSADNEVRPH